MKRQYISLILMLLFVCTIKAQDLNFNENIRKLIENGGKDTNVANPDTIQAVQSPQSQIEKPIEPDIITTPVHHSTQKTPLKMSNEALYWSRYATNSYHKFGSYVTFRDTIIINSLFLPPLFKPGNVMPADTITLYQPNALNSDNWQKPLYELKETLKEQELKLKLENIAYRYVQHNAPYVFHYNAENLPSETTNYISKKTQIKLPVIKKEVDPTEYDAPIKFIPDRKYWISSFESAIKFSENYASSNWHKGGTEKAILNIFTRNILKYNYAKDRIKLDNDIELKANFYNAPNDTLREYKVSDDLLRIHSNLGIKAFNKWYYTFDAELKTQMFTNYQENTMFKQAAFLSPYTINLGLGMKYDFIKQYKRKDRSLALSVNLAPLAYTYMYSIDDSINFARHGFEKDEKTGEFKNRLSKLGSTVRFDMTLKANRNVTWKSRFDYFTSYNRVISEFENSFDFAVSRYFSTLIYLNVRFDDGVTKVKEDDKYIQFNQLLSFGFNYKW